MGYTRSTNAAFNGRLTYMRIAILGGFTTSDTPQTNYVEAFDKAISGHEFVQIRLDQLSIYISSDAFEITFLPTNEPLSNFDFIMIRGLIRRNQEITSLVSKYAKQHTIPCVNDYSNYRPSSKLEQTYVFYQQDVSFIASLYCLNHESLAEQAVERFGYPYILKDILGAHGSHNYLVRSAEHAQEILATTPERVRYIAQAYCPNESDFRILFAGSQVPLIIERKAVGDSHLNNTSQGGSATLATVPDSVIEQARKVIAALEMTIAGVDVLRRTGTDEYNFLEVNSQAQLTTGAFVQEKMQLLSRFFDSQKS